MKIKLPKYPLDLIVTCNLPVTIVIYDILNGEIICERNENPKTQIIKLPFNNGNYIFKSSKNCEIKYNKCLKYNIENEKESKEFVKECYYICYNLQKLLNKTNFKNKLLNLTVFDEIMDNGQWLNTPALVFTKDGQIWIDKKFMKDLTVSERVAIICHERGHFIGNKKQNIDIENEFAADINGLILFCSMGFGQKDYLRAFQKTLDRSKSVENDQRQKVIEKTSIALQEGKIYKPLYKI